MARWLIDLAGVQVRTVGGFAGDPRPVKDFETGAPRTDKTTGKPLFEVRLRLDGEDVGEDITVRVAGDLPGVRRNMPVKVAGLTLQPYSIKGDRPRSGIAFRAERIEAVNGHGKPTG